MQDELSEFEQGIVGKVCRLEIPLTSPSAMMQVADMLRGLANECEWAATSRESTPRARMFQLMMHAREVNRRLKKVRGRGRPPGSVNRISSF